MGYGAAREGDEVLDGLYLGSDRLIFQNVAIQDLRHNSDHFMVIGCLNGTSPRENSHYLR